MVQSMDCTCRLVIEWSGRLKVFGDVDWAIVKDVCVMMVDSCIELLCGVRVSVRSCLQAHVHVRTCIGVI